MDYIKEASYQLIYDYKTRCPYELAASLDIEIVEHNFTGIRGVILTKEGRTFIGVKEGLPEQEKRAVIAHELAHLILHPGMGYYYISENTGFVLGRQEREAEMFAAAILLDEPPEQGESTKEYAMRKGVPRKLVETFYKLR